MSIPLSSAATGCTGRTAAGHHPGREGARAHRLEDASLDPKARDRRRKRRVLFKDPPVSRPQSVTLRPRLRIKTRSPATSATGNRRTSTPGYFDGTSIAEGDAFPGIVGYEYDHMAPADGRPMVSSSSAARMSAASSAATHQSPPSHRREARDPSSPPAPSPGAWDPDDYGHRKSYRRLRRRPLPEAHREHHHR